MTFQRKHSDKYNLPESDNTLIILIECDNCDKHEARPTST